MIIPTSPWRFVAEPDPDPGKSGVTTNETSGGILCGHDGSLPDVAGYAIWLRSHTTKEAGMDFEDFRERVQGERKVRAQRDAAERDIPGERLRREIREAFARESAGELGEVRPLPAEPEPIGFQDAER